MEEQLLLCQCGDPHHQLILYYDKETPAIYVAVHLNKEQNFFKRLWIAFKYIFFKKRSIYGEFEEIMLKPEDANKLQKAVDVLKGLYEKENVFDFKDIVNDPNVKIIPLLLDINKEPN
jgi:hypothetical protein